MSGAINDGTCAPSRLRLDINIGNLASLRDDAAVAALAGRDLYDAVRAAGYAGLQHYLLDKNAVAAGLQLTGMGRIIVPADALEIAERGIALGFEATTVHLGEGLEDDAAADRLADAVLDAITRTGHPLYVETHRGTITQDIRRTLDLIERHPELRFNGDFSHWYTGLAMTYGDFTAKIDVLQPVFDRVRYLHGRIGDPCCMQVPVIGFEDAPQVAHFREFWRRSFHGFLKHSALGDVIPFVPELLPSAVMREGKPHYMYYARLLPDGREETDRWAEALTLCRIAQECFDQAQARTAGEFHHADH